MCGGGGVDCHVWAFSSVDRETDSLTVGVEAVFYCGVLYDLNALSMAVSPASADSKLGELEVVGCW